MSEYKVPIVLNNKDEETIAKEKGYEGKLGKKSEIIVMHILEQLPNIKKLSWIKNKEEQAMYGDIKVTVKETVDYYGEDKDSLNIEVKTGRVYKGADKGCVDVYYKKRNEGMARYKQKSGCESEWVNNMTYDVIVFVCYDEYNNNKGRAYFVYDAYSFLDILRGCLRVQTEFMLGSKDLLLWQWYGKKYEYPFLYEGSPVEGSVVNKSWNNLYETLALNIDLQRFLEQCDLDYDLYHFDIYQMREIF